ncbi:MAG: phosphatidylglycerophosphatase A [Pseudomonadales bacterium]
MTGSSQEPPGSTRLEPASLSDPVVFLVTGFGSGFLRPAPGTWGSLVALGLWWWLLAGLAWPWQLLVIAFVFALGTGLCALTARRHGVHDDGAIVIDEFVGLWLALLAAPATLPVALAGFLLFRAFDIVKPWPVSWADRRPGALGVMLDDLLAGVLAAAVLYGARWLVG